jgi:hypothetical protein
MVAIESPSALGIAIAMPNREPTWNPRTLNQTWNPEPRTPNRPRQNVKLNPTSIFRMSRAAVGFR